MCGLVVALITLSVATIDQTMSIEVGVAILVFSVFALFATSSDVEAYAGVGTSGNVMVLMASLVVFRAYGFFLGPIIVGLLGAIDITQLRERSGIKVVFNACADALSMFGAAGAFWSVTNAIGTTYADLFLGVALSAVVYLLINTLLVAVPVSLSMRESYWRVMGHMGVFSPGAYLFALLGFGLGWVYLEFGAAMVPLLIVPILIARRSFASYLELQASQEQTIETLILALEAKDPYTSGHARRVAMFAGYVGEELGFGTRRMERLRYAALMHDIGKLIVPNQLLNKPGRLTEAEFERVKRHEPVSVELLRRIDFLAPVAGDTTTEAAEAAVKGDAELIEPAVIHVADAFDAMTSTRSYRRALSQETAFSELRNGSGTQFNAQAVDALIHAIERRGELYGAGHEVDEHEWAVAPPESGTGSAGLGDLVPEEQVAGA
jgi:HD superfamily phosphodiesterase